MKNRLSTFDIVTLIGELRKKLVGLRVDQVYDVDRKTYLIRLTKTDTKRMLLIESATRFHTTTFEWPKNPAPSGFTMKLRKHLKNKRIENIEQVGADRIVHFQFGSADFAFHLFLELYDKGNIILTDHSFNILTLVRPHVQGEDRFAAHEKYTTEKAKTRFSLGQDEFITLISASAGKSLREVLLPRIEFGPALFAYVLKQQGLTPQMKLPSNQKDIDLEAKLFNALEEGRRLLETEVVEGGYISFKTSQTTSFDKENKTIKSENIRIYDQFNPIILLSNADGNTADGVIEFPTFDEAVDDFFSKIESQKLDVKQVTQEREAVKKLERVKEDQAKRLTELKNIQETDRRKAELIMFNRELIEQVIGVIRQMIANQVPWDEIWLQIKEAQDKGDILAKRIVKLELLKTQVSISLSDPYGPSEDSYVEVDIDLDLSAYANASKYFDLKKASAKKEERTILSQEKALKSTEKKTISTLREVATIQHIKRARKVFWFEKFYWFISSENYLVLGGHDAHQNELLVKRYLSPNDIYVHSDTHGSPTFIIKNDLVQEVVPPKTLNETCCLAVCYSGSWETKIVASAWWVWGNQVSKSAPTGEYLPTGSFMIRGRKNYLPPSHLVLGFGFLFRISDESIHRHENERPRKTLVGEYVKSGDSKLQGAGATKSTGTDQENQDILSTNFELTEMGVRNSVVPDFPNTEVNIVVGDDVTNEDGDSAGRTRTRTVSTLSSASSHQQDPLEGDNGFIINSGVLPNFEISATKIKKGKKKEQRKNVEMMTSSSTKAQESQGKSIEEQQASTSNKSKRGQHGRQKKIKEKYKDQDDEERELRMQLLHSAGKSKEPPAKLPEPQPELYLSNPKTPLLPMTTDLKCDPEEVPDEAKAPEGDTSDSHMDQLNCLTGCPTDEDELLFAVPVVAPYSTLQNYKFRVKILPGSSKRGKAARSALEIFLKDKLIRQREKDLLKSVKDQDLAKNFPGKVKVATGADKK